MITIKLFENFNSQAPKIYLAGGWSGWRDIVIEHYPGITYLDPRMVGGSPSSNKENWFEHETNMIRECDGVISWLVKDNNSGFGMTYEMGMAYGLNKPYVLIDEKKVKYQWDMQSSGAKNVTSNFKEMFELWSADKIMMPFISQLNDSILPKDPFDNISMD